MVLTSAEDMTESWMCLITCHVRLFMRLAWGLIRALAESLSILTMTRPQKRLVCVRGNKRQMTKVVMAAPDFR